MAKLRIQGGGQYRSEEEVPGQVQVQQVVRLRIKSGAATSGPPIGPVLGQYAIPISKFCTEFNERTQEFFLEGVEIFVTLYYLVDGTYFFDLAMPISSICIRRAVWLDKCKGRWYNGRQAVLPWLWDDEDAEDDLCGYMNPYLLFEVLYYRICLSGGVGNQAIHAVFSNGVGTMRSMFLSHSMIPLPA